MKTKTFDCVRMKHEAQRKRARELADLSEQERLNYYQRAHEALVTRQKSLQQNGR